MRDIILVRHDDFDGVACEIVLRASGLRGNIIVHEATVYNVNKIVNEILDTYDKPNDAVLYITDLSLNKETADRLDKSNLERYLIDHHATAQWMQGTYNWAMINTSSCAALNFYWFLDNHLRSISQKFLDVRRLVHLANDYDLWIHEEEDSRDLNDLMWLIGKEEFIEKILTCDSIQYLTPADRLLLKRENEKKKKYLEETKSAVFPLSHGDKSYILGVCFADSYVSEVGHHLLEKKSEIDIAVIVSLRNMKVSMRTRGNVDCTTIALSYGGGGHPAASGFQIDGEIVLLVFNHIFNPFNYPQEVL